MKRRALILGSGVCGLATAVRLREHDPDLSISMLESEDRVGGLARSLTLRGQVADMGPHRIHTELPDVQEFLETLAGEDMVRVERASRMWLHKTWIEYPPKPFEIVKLFGPLKLAKVGWSYATETLARWLGGGDRRDNFETVMSRAFGSELYRLIVLGYTKKVWKIDPRKIHGDIARVRVSAGGLDQMIKRVFVPEKKGQETALKKFYYIPGGVVKLVDKMHAPLEQSGVKIHTGWRVTKIERTPTNLWRVTSTDDEGRSRTDEAELLFSTIPVTELIDMLQVIRPDAAVRRARESMRFIANFLVCVVVNRPKVTDCQWLYFPGKDTIFNRGYEPKNFSDSMGTENQCMIMLEITCHHGDRIWNATDKQLIRETIKGLERTGLVERDDVVDAMVHRIPYTYPLYDVAYRKRLDPVWRYLEEFSGLISVGRQGLFLHNNMDHSIHMGFRAAEVAMREHPEDPEKHFYKEVRRFQQFRIVD